MEIGGRVTYVVKVFTVKGNLCRDTSGNLCRESSHIHTKTGKKGNTAEGMNQWNKRKKSRGRGNHGGKTATMPGAQENPGCIATGIFRQIGNRAVGGGCCTQHFMVAPANPVVNLPRR